MLELLPWHLSQWQQINNAIANGKLHHALLLAGPEGIGLGQFANLLASKLLCHEAGGEFLCGECKSCILYKAGNHPDIRFIGPEEQGKQIKVELIRDLIEFMQLTNQYGRKKLAIIEPAEAMNRSSANSLLKTLEEPPPDSIIILISHRPALLPVTIRSRCQRINFPGNYETKTISWLRQSISNEEIDAEVLLEIAQGAPLKALNLLEQDPIATREILLQDLNDIRHSNADLIKIAEKWRSFGANEVLRWLMSMFLNMTQLKLKKAGELSMNSNIILYLKDLSNELDLIQLVTCYDEALRHYQALTGPMKLNELSILEDMIVFWQSLDNNKPGNIV